MRPSLAEGSARNPGRVLVLGHPVAGRLIGQALDSEGHPAVLWSEVFPGEALPEPWDHDAVKSLKAHLIELQGRAPGLSAVHPGTSAWAERPELSTIGQDLGLTVIAPPARSLSYFINKLVLLGEVAALEIPHLVERFDPLHTLRELERVFPRETARYPYILKAVRGGGGYGIFIVRGPGDFDQKLPLWLEQVRRNFGEVMLFVERYIDGARHIVVPFARLPDGKIVEFERVDASLQRRHRKLVELCPAPSIDEAASAKLSEWTRTLSERLGFVGVGSFEFLVDGPRAFFVDAAPRLSTTYRLWEQVSGTSAVAWQLACQQSGLPLPKFQKTREWSYGISLKLQAEDSVHQLPQPGRVDHLALPQLTRRPGVNLEVHLALESGSTVPYNGEGLLGFVQIGTPEFERGFGVATQVLREIWIQGTLQTNERFLIELLEHPWVSNGVFHAGFVEEEFIPQTQIPTQATQVALEALTIAEPSVRQWMIGERIFSSNGASTSIETLKQTPEWFLGRLRTQAGEVHVGLSKLSSLEWRARVGQWQFRVRKCNLSPAPRPGMREVRSLVSGRVHALWVQPGHPIRPREYLAIVESLGMLVPHAVTLAGRLVEWKVHAEDQVAAGQVLGVFEEGPLGE